jgi:hypothetical protein
MLFSLNILKEEKYDFDLWISMFLKKTESRDNEKIYYLIKIDFFHEKTEKKVNISFI